MKKILALLLVAVMCFPLVACFGDDSTEDIVGKWQSLDGGILEFFEDGTVTRGGEVLNWWYDKEFGKYFVSDGDTKDSFTLKLFESRRFFTLDDEIFYSADTFNMVYWGFMQEKIASLTEGKTELVVGEAYTTSDGVEFVVEKVELTSHESGYAFNIYINHIPSIRVGNGDYEATYSGWVTFDITEDSGKTVGDTHCYSGGSLDMEDLKNDKNYFGILSLTINDSECYIQIQSFFE